MDDVHENFGFSGEDGHLLSRRRPDIYYFSHELELEDLLEYQLSSRRDSIMSLSWTFSFTDYRTNPGFLHSNGVD